MKTIRYLNTPKATPFLLAAAMSVLSACGGGGADAPPDNVTADTNRFMNTLPTWDEFAPRQRPAENEGAEQIDASTPPTVEDIVDPDSNTTKVCTTEKVSFYDTPDEYVMFSPPRDILYPGAFIQGKSLRDGNNPGQLLPLIINQRSAVNVSIPACAIPNNFRRVQPTQANIESAISDILFEASGLGVDCVNPNGSIRVDTYRNEQQRALKAGMSGRYLGFSASASGSYSKTKIQNSVAMIFRESLYTVQIEAPQTPGQWFSQDFTADQLQRQIDLGRMGKDNVPTYVAQVVYGRIMMSTMTSSFSEADMKAALEFKYNNPVAGVQGKAATKSKTIREASNMTLAYLGGDAQATADMLRSQDWTQYFSQPATADDAVPISFVLKSTADNSPAVVQELTEYDRVTCYDKLADDATFELKDEQLFDAGFSDTGSVVAIGDIDGKNGDDLIWASTSARGEMAVAFANGDGTFAPPVNTENSAINGITGEFYLLISDVNADGSDDIVINILGPNNGENTVFVSFYQPDGATGFVHSSGQVMAQSRGWHTYQPRIGQMDGKRGGDLLWNNALNSTSINRSYIGHAVDTTLAGFDLAHDPLFKLTPAMNHSGNTSGIEYIHVADFNGDGRDDVMWQNIDLSGNRYYIGLGTETGLALGSGAKAPYFRDFGGHWSTYVSLPGDANGDGRADLIEPRQRSPFSQFGIYFGQGSDNQSRVIDAHSFEFHNDPTDDVAIRDLIGQPTPVEPEMYLADVNADGSQDLLIIDKGHSDNLTNIIGVGLSIPGGSQFSFNRATQELTPKEDWSQYRVLIGDINGDLRDDVLWVRNGATHSVYAGIARSK